METIVLKPLQHRGQECIGIYFEPNNPVQFIIQKKVGAKWSRTHTCWHVACAKEKYDTLVDSLKSVASIDASELKKYLLEKTRQQKVLPSAIQQDRNEQIKVKSVQKKLFRHTLSEQNSEAFRLFRQQLVLKGYSESTIQTYSNELLQFLNLIGEKSAKDLNAARLKDYLQYCHTTLHLSENTLHSRINALKFYYEQVLNREKFFWEIPRPKKPLQLPAFFSQEEITSIINAVSNVKHKAMLMLAYSAGLRVSEVVALRTFHIDSKRMSILIKSAKGKKDRMLPLSPVVLIMLREYYAKYKPKKDGYLFAGQLEGEPYSARSLQQVLSDTKNRAKIIKPGSVHALRHSFATHLLDKGTDVTLIMKLLGHNDLKTTLQYLHVTNRDMLQIISPLDDLKLL